mmetsp:Transcript_11768/g.19592  ORF Transcript_11768/g.19592 Transcript_11768/m.19592 type:complete len:205 (-) Transcript_11768:230-844(-)
MVVKVARQRRIVDHHGSRRGGGHVEVIEGRHGDGIDVVNVGRRGTRRGRDGRARHAVDAGCKVGGKPHGGGGNIRMTTANIRTSRALELGNARDGGGIHTLQFADLPLELVDPGLGLVARGSGAGPIPRLALLLAPLGPLLFRQARIVRLVLEVVLVGAVRFVGRGGDGVELGLRQAGTGTGTGTGTGGDLALLSGGGEGGHDG